MGLIRIMYMKISSFVFFLFSRVYLATKKNDENETKYAIKVINKHDIRKKNLIDQSKETAYFKRLTIRFSLN